MNNNINKSVDQLFIINPTSESWNIQLFDFLLIYIRTFSNVANLNIEVKIAKGYFLIKWLEWVKI